MSLNSCGSPFVGYEGHEHIKIIIANPRTAYSKPFQPSQHLIERQVLRLFDVGIGVLANDCKACDFVLAECCVLAVEVPYRAELLDMS